MKYYNALMATVLGNEDESNAAIEYLKEVDPEVWNGEESVALSSDFDLAIIATPHDYLDLSKIGNVPILNTRGSI